MRVVDPLKGDAVAERRRLDMALLVDLLQRRADAGIVKIAVDVELVWRGLIDQLEAIGLQYRAIAELAVEPGELGEEQPVSKAQIVFEIGEVVIAAESAAQHLVALETE